MTDMTAEPFTDEELAELREWPSHRIVYEHGDAHLALLLDRLFATVDSRRGGSCVKAGDALLGVDIDEDGLPLDGPNGVAAADMHVRITGHDLAIKSRGRSSCAECDWTWSA